MEKQALQWAFEKHFDPIVAILETCRMLSVKFN